MISLTRCPAYRHRPAVPMRLLGDLQPLRSRSASAEPLVSKQLVASSPRPARMRTGRSGHGKRDGRRFQSSTGKPVPQQTHANRPGVIEAVPVVFQPCISHARGDTLSGQQKCRRPATAAVPRPSQRGPYSDRRGAGGVSRRTQNRAAPVLIAKAPKPQEVALFGEAQNLLRRQQAAGGLAGAARPTAVTPQRRDADQ